MDGASSIYKDCHIDGLRPKATVHIHLRMWSMENTGQKKEHISCTAKERPLYSALFFQRANKEANVAAETSYVVRVKIAEKRESLLLKARFSRDSM